MTRSSIRTTLYITFLMCVPIALSYFFFMGQSLRLDESQSLWQMSRNVPDIFTIVAGDVHVPLYHLLLHFWILYLGYSVATARLLSLVLYVLCIPALYFLGKFAYSRNVGIFAALLFSISPFMNWYGNEIRMYTLFTFFVIINQYFFIRIFKNKHPRNPELDWIKKEHIWAGYVLTGIAGVFSHYFFFLSLTSQMVFYFTHRDLFPPGSLKRFSLAALLITGSFAPWGWYVLHLGQVGFQEPVLAMPTSINLFNTFSQFLFGFQNDNLNTFFLSLWPITVIFGLFTLRRNHRMMPETEYFLTTLLFSIAIAFFGSFIVAPIFVSRYLIFTVPSLYLLLSSLFSNYSPSIARSARFAVVALMIGTLGLEIISPTAPVKEDYASAVDYLNTHTTAQDVIVLSAPFTVYPVQYYYRGMSPIQTLPVWNQYVFGAIPAFSQQSLGGEVTQVTGSSQVAYVLLSYNQGYEDAIKKYFDTHYQRTAERSFSPDLNLYVYKLRYDTSLSAATSTALLQSNEDTPSHS